MRYLFYLFLQISVWMMEKVTDRNFLPPNIESLTKEKIERKMFWPLDFLFLLFLELSNCNRANVDSLVSYFV